MSQICQGVIEPGITLFPGSTDSIPLLWLTDKAISEFQERRKETLLNTGFVRYINIIDEENLKILPSEAVRVLKRTIKEYPYSLITYVLALGDFYLIRIIFDHMCPDRITISHENLVDVPELWTTIDVLKQRAFLLEDLSLQLGSPEGEA